MAKTEETTEEKELREQEEARVAYEKATQKVAARQFEKMESDLKAYIAIRDAEEFDILLSHVEALLGDTAALQDRQLHQQATSIAANLRTFAQIVDARKAVIASGPNVSVPRAASTDPMIP